MPAYENLLTDHPDAGLDTEDSDSELRCSCETLRPNKKKFLFLVIRSINSEKIMEIFLSIFFANFFYQAKFCAYFLRLLLNQA